MTEEVLETSRFARGSTIATLARGLTVGRLLIAPLFAWLLLQVAAGGPGRIPLACLYLLVVLSDFFDGRLARRANASTPAWGRWDAGADVLFNFSSLSAAAWRGLVGAWVPAGVLVLGGRFLWRSFERAPALAEDRFGKLAGVIFYALVGAIVAELVLPFPVLGWHALARAGDAVFLYTAFTFWSGRRKSYERSRINSE